MFIMDGPMALDMFGRSMAAVRMRKVEGRIYFLTFLMVRIEVFVWSVELDGLF